MFLSEVSNDVAINLVSKTAERAFGSPFRVRYERESARAVGAATVARAETEAEERRIRQALGEARRHERVTEAVEILGARVKDIRLAKGAEQTLRRGGVAIVRGPRRVLSVLRE